MIEILNKYCDKGNGLLLFNPPTGSGKTHNVLQWIFDNYKDYCEENKKIFFLTNLKKNLPFDELKNDFFIPNNKGLDFDKHIVFLDSNSDSLLKRFNQVEGSIDEYFKKHSVFSLIKHCVSRITKHENNTEFIVKDSQGNLNCIKKTKNYTIPEFDKIL